MIYRAVHMPIGRALTESHGEVGMRDVDPFWSGTFVQNSNGEHW